MGHGFSKMLQMLNFDSNGNITITGTINATAGKIGGFNIADTGLYKIDSTGKAVYLNTDAIRLGTNGTEEFFIDNTGYLQAQNANILGKLTTSVFEKSTIRVVGGSMLYKTAEIIDEIPPFGERFDFFEPIQGGQHFFEYVNRFLSEFREFRGGKDDTGRPYQVIHKYLCGYSDRWYAYVMEALLFCYYLKFGTSYLNEAALTIVRYISQIRFEKGRAYEPTILEYAGDSGIVPIILQSSSPTFFLAKMESKIKRFSPVDISNGNVRKWFKISCKNISSEIEKNCITNYFKNYYKSHYGNITSK